MTALRRLSFAAFVVACAHLVFGAIVRITGSGMGCGDHWPKCYGQWFPPLNRPDLVIEISHRWLAAFLIVSMLAVLGVAFSRRALPGVGGRGGVLRSAALAVVLVVSAALLGAVTVKLGNPPVATLGHWTIAMGLVAAAAASVMRAGGFGAQRARASTVSPKTRRAAFAAAGVALVTVVMGGLTAKFPGAAVACQSFPLCGTNPDVQASAVHVQVTHRVLALLLVLHLIGVVFALRKRGEAPIFRRAAAIALSLGVLQLLVAGAMVGMRLPPALRSLHEATGVSIWVATFVFAYLARLGGLHPPVILSAAKDLHLPSRSGAGATADVRADPSVAALPQDDRAAVVILSPSTSLRVDFAKDLHLAVEPTRVTRSTSGHSVAVIIARGADA